MLCAKYAAAFFKMSRSCNARRNWDSSSEILACSLVGCCRVKPPADCEVKLHFPLLNFVTHALKVPGGMPRLVATSVTDRFRLMTWSEASLRNSGVNLCIFLFFKFMDIFHLQLMLENTKPWETFWKGFPDPSKLIRLIHQSRFILDYNINHNYLLNFQLFYKIPFKKINTSFSYWIFLKDNKLN